MNIFQTGYASVNINPSLGIAVCGYYVPRFAKGFLDDLEVSALVLSLGEKKIALIAVDSCELYESNIKKMTEGIEKETGIPKDNIFISASHTHTGPCPAPSTVFEADPDPILKYADFLAERVVDSVKLALMDLRPTKMGYIVGYAPERVAYIRRYKMKDGTTQTCPPINDPNIDYPLGELDQRVNVLRFDREGSDTVVLVNYGLHADTINGEMISADWPSWMRRTLDKALDGVKCMFFNGAEGDVGSTNVHPSGGDMNDTEISFDNEMKSPGMARFVGRAIAGTVLQVYDKVNYVDVNEIDIIKKAVALPANIPSPEDLPLAKKYKEYHEMGRDDLIPYSAMELTTVVAEALRMCEFENSPETIDITLTGVKIGGVALIGIPGEPFTEIGVQIKDNDDMDLILPVCLTNGCEGYFPTESAFAEGGYEARTSHYKAGTADAIVRAAREMIAELKA